MLNEIVKLVIISYYTYILLNKMSSSRKLRSDAQIDIKYVGPVSFAITGSKLPSKRQVLQVMFYHMRFFNLNSKSSARATIHEVLVFWEKAGIPTPKESRCIEKLEKVYESWKALKKTVQRECEKHKKDVDQFIAELDDLFDIAHANAMEMMKIQEDKDFLLQQRQKGRPGCMIGVDAILVAKEKKKEQRIEQEKRRMEKWEASMQQQNGNY